MYTINIKHLQLLRPTVSVTTWNRPSVTIMTVRETYELSSGKQLCRSQGSESGSSTRISSLEKPYVNVPQGPRVPTEKFRDGGGNCCSHHSWLVVIFLERSLRKSYRIPVKVAFQVILQKLTNPSFRRGSAAL
jgi:hypothetical protein